MAIDGVIVLDDTGRVSWSLTWILKPVLTLSPSQKTCNPVWFPLGPSGVSSLAY
jgi:hypothetical protein